MAAALFLLQHIYLTLELGVGGDGAGLHQHHAALDVLLLDAAQQQAHVVAGHALVEQFAEHLHTGDDGLAGVPNTHNLDFLAHLHLAALDPAGGHGATTGDREHVFHSHQEGLVDLALGLGDGGVDSIHQLIDLGFPFGVALEGLEAGDLHHGDVITGEVVAGEQLAHFQFHQLEDLLVVHHVALVECHH